MDAELAVDQSGALLASFRARPMLIEEIAQAQQQDQGLIETRASLREGSQSDF